MRWKGIAFISVIVVFGAGCSPDEDVTVPIDSPAVTDDSTTDTGGGANVDGTTTSPGADESPVNEGGAIYDDSNVSPDPEPSSSP